MYGAATAMTLKREISSQWTRIFSACHMSWRINLSPQCSCVNNAVCGWQHLAWIIYKYFMRKPQQARVWCKFLNRFVPKKSLQTRSCPSPCVYFFKAAYQWPRSVIEVGFILVHCVIHFSYICKETILNFFGKLSNFTHHAYTEKVTCEEMDECGGPACSTCEEMYDDSAMLIDHETFADKTLYWTHS